MTPDNGIVLLLSARFACTSGSDFTTSFQRTATTRSATYAAVLNSTWPSLQHRHRHYGLWRVIGSLVSLFLSVLIVRTYIRISRWHMQRTHLLEAAQESCVGRRSGGRNECRPLGPTREDCSKETDHKVHLWELANQPAP